MTKTGTVYKYNIQELCTEAEWIAWLRAIEPPEK